MMNSALIMMNSALIMMNSALIMMNSALMMMNSVVNTMEYVLQKMNSAFKMMNFGRWDCVWSVPVLGKLAHQHHQDLPGRGASFCSTRLLCSAPAWFILLGPFFFILFLCRRRAPTPAAPV